MIYITLISAIIAVISLRYAMKLRKYLKDFTSVSQQIRNLQFYARLDESTKGELGELSRNFNSMISIMENTINEVEDSKIRIESVLKSISDGIVAIDVNSNIILINSKAKIILGCEYEEVEGKHIGYSIKQKEILKEIISNKGNKVSKKIEININITF